MKKFLALTLVLCLLFTFVGCGKTHTVRDFDTNIPPTTESTVQTQPNEPETLPTEPPESAITPILYKVSDDSGHVVWLFGSIHVGYDHFYPLPEYVMQAYQTADALAVECDVVAFDKDLGAQMNALRGMVYTDGTKISNHIPEELYTEAVAALTDAGMYMATLDMYKPVLWSSFLDSALVEVCGADSNLGIDMYFLNDAHETGKEILEVESAQFQYDMLSGFSPKLQELLLEGSVYGYQNQEEYRQQMEELLDAWASGDETRIATLIHEEMEPESEEERLLYEEYSYAMSESRNLAMIDWAEEALASGDTVFIVVGAAHVVGPGAMAELLTQRGYTVEAVRP